MPSRNASPPEKWEPAEGEIIACAPAVEQLHLRAFATAFIDERCVDRWIHSTIDKPAKARACLAKFPHHLVASRCTRVSGTDLWPQSLTRRYGAGLGFFLSGRGQRGLTTVAHASTFRDDAIFSIVPGQHAVFFFHEGWGWLCAR